MILWCILGAILAVAMAWFLLKEVIEPHWTIRLGDLVSPGPLPVTMALGNGLVLHAYSDTRPHVGKITPLQKGLVLVQDGQELIEEGYGFGTPIVVLGGRSYLSQHAGVSASPDGPRSSNGSGSTSRIPGRNRSAGSTARSSRWAASFSLTPSPARASWMSPSISATCARNARPCLPGERAGRKVLHPVQRLVRRPALPS